MNTDYAVLFLLLTVVHLNFIIVKLHNIRMAPHLQDLLMEHLY